VAVLIDIDQDHDLDLYLINDAKGDVPFSANNRMFRNQGDGQFKLDDANDLGLNIRIAGMGLGVGDLNDDAKPDLFMSGTRGLYLMMSSQGAWYDATQSSGIVVTDNPDRVEGWGIEFADLDNDGDLDAPVMFGSLFGDSGGDEMPDAFYRNEGDQTFQEVATEFGLDDAGLGRGVLAVDINGDGWLDLLKRELGGGLLYYRARCGEASFSKVDLLQGGKNPQAIGAVIELTADGVTQRRWVLGAGTSFSSNGPLTQHFGLGSSESIERVVVTWPDGEQTLYEDVAVRERLVLER
jgi:hypothetical protein